MKRVVGSPSSIALGAARKLPSSEPVDVTTSAPSVRPRNASSCSERTSGSKRTVPLTENVRSCGRGTIRRIPDSGVPRTGSCGLLRSRVRTTVRPCVSSSSSSRSTSARGVRIHSVVGPDSPRVSSANPTAERPPGYVESTGTSRSVITMSKTAPVSGSKATVSPSGSHDREVRSTVRRSPSVRISTSVMRRLASTSGCTACNDSTVTGVPKSYRRNSPRPSAKAATAQAVLTSPSPACTGRSSSA